jgi:hypothetical protein
MENYRSRLDARRAPPCAAASVWSRRRCRAAWVCVGFVRTTNSVLSNTLDFEVRAQQPLRLLDGKADRVRGLIGALV